MWKWKPICRCGVTKKSFYHPTCLVGALRATLPAANKRPRSGQIGRSLKNPKKKKIRKKVVTESAFVCYLLKWLSGWKRCCHTGLKENTRAQTSAVHRKFPEVLPCRSVLHTTFTLPWGCRNALQTCLGWKTPDRMIAHAQVCRTVLIAWFGFGCRSTHPNPGPDCWIALWVINMQGFDKEEEQPEIKKKRKKERKWSLWFCC